MTYEATDGRRVMLLVETKYSESYGVSYKRFRSDGSDRIACYRDLYYSGNSPIDITVVPEIETMLFEPFYQLPRQQLLATRVMETGIPDVDHVLVDPESFVPLPVEDLFKTAPVAAYPELEPLGALPFAALLVPQVDQGPLQSWGGPP